MKRKGGTTSDGNGYKNGNTPKKSKKTMENYFDRTPPVQKVTPPPPKMRQTKLFEVKPTPPPLVKKEKKSPKNSPQMKGFVSFNEVSPVKSPAKSPAKSPDKSPAKSPAKSPIKLTTKYSDDQSTKSPNNRVKPEPQSPKEEEEEEKMEKKVATPVKSIRESFKTKSQAPVRKEDKENTTDEEHTEEEDHSVIPEPISQHYDSNSVIKWSTRKDSHPSWARPPLARAISPTVDSIIFQQYDVTYSFGPHIKMSAENSTQSPTYDPGQDAPIIRFFGITANGNSVLVHIYGYRPYFYVELPKAIREQSLKDKSITDKFLDKLKAEMNRRMSGGGDKGHQKVKKSITSMDIVMKESIKGFPGVGHKGREFIRVFAAIPPIVPRCRRILETGVTVGGFGHYSWPVTYESNIQFVLRYMIEANIEGCNWLELPAKTYDLLDEDKKISRCQIEVNIHWEDVLSRNYLDDEQWSKLAKLRIMSYDIECSGRPDVFPVPEKDPVIMIANYVVELGTKKPFIKNVFTLKGCSSIVGADVRCFETEKELLAAWRAFVLEVDPDILTGYNTNNFDMWYLIERARAIKVQDFTILGKLLESRSKCKEATWTTKAVGKRVVKEINISGRVQLDMLQVMQSEHKLRSYTLNYVSSHFLKEQKEDVHYSIITKLFKGTNEDRHRLAVYCLKDAYLPLRLMDKLESVIVYIEMARVTGVPLSYVLTRGQQIRVVSKLYRAANPINLLIPTENVVKPKKGEKAYKGAIVIAPKRALYKEPIVTLDFSSLYPSIMIAHNLCYTTLIKDPEVLSKLEPEDYEVTPSKDNFVRAHVKSGILPGILQDLLRARSVAKKEMALATDPLKKAVLNGRQLALKTVANAVYGFTGFLIGKLPCTEIASSVTAFGRDMIEKTALLIEKQYPGADVIYGDTDSVMVNFGVKKDIAEAMRLGRETSKFVTSQFEKPISLEFEKVYWPYLLINKKKYAGLYYSKVDHWDFVDYRGIESVRRDSCALVKNVVETSLKKILIDDDIQGSIDYVKQLISDLLCNKLDLSLLVISKALTRNKEAYTTKQAHVELAKKMELRDLASAPSLGDRVQFVIVKGAKGDKNYEKAEDPLYVLENNIALDTEWYLDHQLREPILRLFGPICDEKELMTGEHMNKRKVLLPASGTKGTIMGWTTVQLSCLGCRAPITEGAVCKYCKEKEGDIYRGQMEVVRDLEKQFAVAWTQCQRCQGSFHQEVLCTARDCPIFYLRTKLRKDLASAQVNVNRFEHETDLSW